MVLDRIFCRLRLVFNSAKGFMFAHKVLNIKCLYVSPCCPSRLAGMAGGVIFILGSFGNFRVFKKGRLATKGVMRANWGWRHAVLPILFMGIFRSGEERRWQ
jgi:hypothetical protein